VSSTSKLPPQRYKFQRRDSFLLPYLNKCPSRDLVEQAEAEAKQQKRGVWSDAKFINPWEYRSLYKSKS
jgi:endonuclease YncB( thermonuclease family)